MRDSIVSALKRPSLPQSWIIASLLVIQTGGTLRLTNISVPLVADVRNDMELSCQFDMGAEELYAVKWYKDDQEFFRYMPQQRPETVTFPVAGVHLIDKTVNCGPDTCQLTLRGLTRDHSGGAYRCEISSEAPTFRLASETRNVTIAALPREMPKIEGLIGPYGEGDVIATNCVSDLADPAPILSWYINNHEVLSRYVGEMRSSEADERGLVSRSLTLRFPVDRKHSQAGTIELRCVATLPGIPQLPQSTSVDVATLRVQPHFNDNQRLHWQSMTSTSTSGCRRHRQGSLAMICIVVTLFKFR